MRLVILLLVLVPVVSALQITEIMYDPEGNDNNREYIEVFTNGSNLTDVVFEDLTSSDALELVQFFEGEYALIVEEDFNGTDMNVSVYSAGKTIGNGLNNDRDLVLLRDNKSVLDAVFYVSKRDGGGNNGKALCRLGDVFMECIPSPGEINNLSQQADEQNYTLWISEFLPDPEGDDKGLRPGGEWVELYNSGEQVLDLRGLMLEDAKNHTITISDAQISDPLLQPGQYGVVYLNGQSLLNNDGFELITLRTQTAIIDQTSYSFSKEGLSWSQDFATRSFTLTVPTPGAVHRNEEASLNSSLVLERVYVGNDDVVRFGESFRVRLKVYKGDTEKTTVKVYVANLSKQTTVSIEEKFVEHVFTLTLPLVPNCHGKLADGIYTVRAEGFATEAVLPVTIKGTAKDSCVVVQQNMTKETVALKEARKTKEPLQQTTMVERSDTFINKTGRVVYEASDSKARRWAVYFFCFTLLLVIAALVTQD